MILFVHFIGFMRNRGKGFFEVLEFESILKFELASFLVPLSPIFPQNFNITPGPFVVQARQCLHSVSRPFTEEYSIFTIILKSQNVA